MAVLGNDPDRPERGGGAQNRADVMRIGDLIEDQQHGTLSRAAQDFVEPDLLERFGFDHHALVGSIARNQPAEVGDVGECHRNLLGKLHRRGRIARRPCAQDLPPRIVERGCNGVTAPEARTVGRAVLVMRAFAGHAAPLRMDRAGRNPCW